MHPTELPQYALDGALRRRGKIHAVEHVDPAKCALVVIDMQNVFLQKGAPAETPIAVSYTHLTLPTIYSV